MAFRRAIRKRGPACLGPRQGIAPGRNWERSVADDKDVKMQRIAGHSEERFLGSDIFESTRHTLPPPRRGGTIREEAREIDVYHQCDVAVIGGGPDGCAAAWA